MEIFIFIDYPSVLIYSVKREINVTNERALLAFSNLRVVFAMIFVRYILFFITTLAENSDSRKKYVAHGIKTPKRARIQHSFDALPCQ